MSSPEPRKELAPVGLLPAAGRGLRFAAAGYIKELFPLLPRVSAAPVPAGPRPICERALRQIRAAGAARCVVVLSPQKLMIAEVLAEGAHLDLALGYVLQAEPRGLPDAVRCAGPWLGERSVLLALPDTVVLPVDALARVEVERQRSGADVVLGLFPVATPECLGPVEFDGDGRVLRVHDKPARSPVDNSWGVASWSPRFTDFCRRWEAAQGQASSPPGERVLGHTFEAARQAGLTLRAVWFPQGHFVDIGNPDGLRQALALLATGGELDPAQAELARLLGPGRVSPSPG
ncbi:MAG TPA: sugar phosphate nucleotidyltransferase [Pseudomonadota bacterium]|nr:sugar phosphate nucleotidyltransferase [Pseudomonadota bacterium]